jgi:GAF domain-containing protein
MKNIDVTEIAAKLQQREAELTMINSVQQALLAKKELLEIYELIGEKLRALFDAQVTGIYTFDLDTEQEYFQYLFEDGERLYPEPRPLNQIRLWLIKNADVLLVNENADETIEKITGDKHVAVPGTRLPKSLLFVPLIVDKQVNGCLSLQNLDKENAFTDSDVQLLNTLANSISIALENARLFNETEQRNAELAVINSVQQGLVAEMDMQGIYDLVGNKIRDLFDAQVATISIFDHENRLEIFKYLYEKGKRFYPEPRPIDKVRQRMIKTRKMILVNENAVEAFTTITGEAPKAVPGTVFPKSILFVPLSVGEAVQGYVSLQNLDREYAFSESDVQLLNTLANTMSVALENARLFNETEQRNAELAVINSVQEGLVAEMDMQGIYDLVGDRIRDLFDAQVTAIVIFDLDEKKEDWKYLFEDGDRLYPSKRPYDKVREKIIKDRKALLFNENAAEKLSEINGEPHKPIPGTRVAKSALYVPLLLGNQVQGYVTLQNLDREHAFNDSDVRLLGTLANSMSVALENARLFSETEQRNAELAVINSVQQGLVAEMDMQGIYDLVGDRIRDLFDSQVTMIVTFDQDSSTEHFQYLFEDGERLYPDSRPLDKIRKWIIKNARLLLVNEDADDTIHRVTGEPKGTTIPGTRLPQSLLFVPLIVGDEVRGCVSLQNLDHEHAFSDADVRLLSTLANSMSVALENARLFNETEKKNAELAVINSVQQGLVAEMDMQGIYDLVGEKIRDLFDAQVVGICTFNHETNTEYFHHLFEDDELHKIPPRPIDNLRKRLINTGELILINENADDAWREITGEEPTVAEGTKPTKSALYVPMAAGDTVFGYITLQNLDREHAFNESDVRLLNTLVNSMSVALENARLFSETTRLLAVTEQRNAELAVINSVQDGLVREMDMQMIYEIVGEKICDVLNTQTMIIRTFNHEEGLEYWQYAVEKGERIEVEPRPFIWANKILIETKKHLLINENYEETAVKYDGTAITKGLAPKSAVFVPMIVGDVVVGSVSLQNVEKEHAFSESDLQLITTLTNSMSVAVENARLFNETTRLLAETEKRAAEMQTVNNISRAMVSQLEFDKLIQLVGEQMKSLFNADIVYLALHDAQSNMLHFPYTYGDDTMASRPFGNNITEKIIREREPLLVNQNLKKTYEQLKLHRRGEWVESYLGVPIIAGKEAIGVISVQSKSTETRFNENDLRLLTTIAASVGVAMQNAEAYQKMRLALNDLKAAQVQLIQQEKLASLGQLTAGIAHEIKNPLNFVNNFSEVSLELVEEVREEFKSEKAEVNKQKSLILEILDDIEANLRKIHEHGTRADGIVKSMLQHSRGGSGKMEPTDLNAIIKEFVNLAFHGMRAGKEPINVDIDLNLDEYIGEVPLITEDFSRVILNLCNNSFDAMREKQGSGDKDQGSGGYLPKLTVRTKSDNGKVTIEIEDNGPGIPDVIKDKILQPFFTTKKGTQGTGLGLSITNDIIKAHGGSMAIVSEPGKTCFKIDLVQN